MSLLYIIDGYNLVNHREFRRSNNKISDDRLALLEFIRRNRLTGSLKNKVVVVFDGYPQSQSPNYGSDAEVIFSKDESADERIKKITEKSGNTANTVVVSDDREIQIMAKFLGARALGVEEFIEVKKKARRAKDEAPEPGLTYTQMHKINQELSKIWLKQ